MPFTRLPLLAACAALLLQACSPLRPAAPVAPAPSAERSYRITVLHTNDHHGRFWRNRDGEAGMAARKTVVDGIRREVAEQGGYTLLLDGGDVNTGVPESDLQDAVPDFTGMNALGYDAMAVGNHEFDKPPGVLAKQRRLAQFPMLSANIYQGGQRMFQPYKVFQLGPVRVAVMGLTTDDTRKMVHPDHIRGVEFRSPIQEAAQLVPELHQQADIVIAATHMGHYEDGQHGSLAPGDVEMARAVKGLDLIVGGHSQNPVCMESENHRQHSYVPGTPCTPDRQNGTWIVQAHEWGKYVGRADFDYRSGQLTLVRYALIPINLKHPVAGNAGDAPLVNYTPEIAEDPGMLALLAPYQDYGQQQLSLTVGRSDQRLQGDRPTVRSQQTNLGLLIGRAMQERTQADLALINAGSVRDSLPAGELTYKDILKVHPFGNTLVTVDLSGREVLHLLQVAAGMSAGAGAYPQLSGVRFAVRGGAVEDVHIRGQALDPQATYRLVTNNFVASGGDGYPVYTRHPGFVDTGYVDAEVLRAYLLAHSPLRVADYAAPSPIQRR